MLWLSLGSFHLIFLTYTLPEKDIYDIQNQLSKVYESKDLSIVTPHCFEAEWISSTKEYNIPFIVTNHR